MLNANMYVSFEAVSNEDKERIDSAIALITEITDGIAKCNGGLPEDLSCFRETVWHLEQIRGGNWKW